MKTYRALCLLLTLGWVVAFRPVSATPFTPNPEDFEDANAPSRWPASNGVWEVGVPTSGPGAAHSGSNCLATVLGGNYPAGQFSRAVGPRFDVPQASQNPSLRFWHWFSFGSGTGGVVEVSTDNGATWELLSVISGSSGGVWTTGGCDLTAYAGRTVLLGFRIYAFSGFPSSGPGWYIDEVTVKTGPVGFPALESFEDANAPSRWPASNGVWEVGVPTSGPGAAHSGINCLATVLGGNYPAGQSSRAVGPRFDVPQASQNPSLRFWHWFSFGSGTGGVVEVSTDNGANWQSLSSIVAGSSGGVWTIGGYDLTPYAGQTVLLGFRIYAFSGFPSSGPGWYIDEVQIQADGGPVPPSLATLPATGVTATSALLNGNLDPKGAETTAHFEYGTNSSLAGSVATSDQNFGGSGLVSVQASLAGLPPNTIHYYRLVTSSTAGPSGGGVVSFVTASDSPLRGNFTGLVVADPGLTDQSGSLQLRISASRAFTGVLLWAGRRYALTGTLDAGGHFEGTVPGTNLDLTLDAADGEVLGTLTDGLVTAAITLEQIDTGGSFSPRTGKFTAISDITAAAGAASVPGGSGYTVVTISETSPRRARFVGALCDRIKWSAGSNGVTRRRSYTVSSGLYPDATGKFRGLVQGEPAFGDDPARFAGPLSWSKKALGGADFPDGFAITLSLDAAYFKPNTTNPITFRQDLRSNAEVQFTNGGLTTALHAFCKVRSDNGIYVRPPAAPADPTFPQGLTITFLPDSPLFQGSFTHPETLKTAAFTGVFHQPLQVGRGYFKTRDAGGLLQTGGVSFRPIQ